MQYLNIIVAILNELIFSIQNNPVASGVTGAALGVAVFLLPSLLLRRRDSIRSARLEEEQNRKLKSLQESLSLKTVSLATAERTCEDQKRALANANERIARLEQSAKTIPVLEAKIEQQLRQIESLTDAMVSEFNVTQPSDAVPAPAESSDQTREPLTTEIVIDQLSNRLYQQLSALHQQIADQCRLITELQAELNARSESVTQQIITKGQKLPGLAKTRFDQRVIEPIQMRVDGLKRSVQAIPDQTRAKFDQIVLNPIQLSVNEIKSGLHQIPVYASTQLSKIVLEPLNDFIHSVNQAAKNFTVNSQEKFKRLITNRLEDLIARLKMSGSGLSGEMLEHLNRIIVRPLERLLAEVRDKASAVPEQGLAKFNEHLVRPAIVQLQAMSESGKQTSIRGFKQLGYWIIDSLTRRSAPAAVA